MSTCSRGSVREVPRGCPPPAAYSHTERSERSAGGDWIWKKRVPGVSSAPTRPSQERRSSAMSSADEDAPFWERDTGDVDVRGLGSGREGYLDLDDRYQNPEDSLEFLFDNMNKGTPSEDVDTFFLDEINSAFPFGDDLLRQEVEEGMIKQWDTKVVKPPPLKPTTSSPSVPEYPCPEKGCSRCRDKNAKGTGMSLFFMARDKDFSSKIDAGEKESLFLEGKQGHICFHYSKRDNSWDGCFCKFVKMILGVPIRNKNNGTYYDQFKVNGNVRRECFDENGQVMGNRVLWNKFYMFVWFDYLPALEDDIRPPRPRAPKELKRREEVKRVIHWLKLVDEAHQRGESTMKEELDGFFQSLHDLLHIHKKWIAEEKRVTNAHKFLFVHAFRQFFGSDVTGHIGYFADDRPRLLHARPSNAFVLQADAKRRRLEQHDVRGYVKDPDFFNDKGFESPQQTLQQT